MAFTEKELAYLGSQELGRLATVGRNGEPHNVPLGFQYNAELGTIDITGRDMGKSRKYRDVQDNAKVAFVVDDVVDPTTWEVRGVEVRGVAEAVDELIRITPARIISWGIEAHISAGYHARDTHKAHSS